MKLVFKNESDFKKELMLEEVEDLSNKFPLENDKFDFRINYILENETNYEVEFYFRNNTNSNLSIGKIPLHFLYNEMVIAIEVIDFKKEFGIMPAKSIKAFNFFISKENVYYPEFLEKSFLKIASGFNFKVKDAIENNIVNMPSSLSYDQKIYFEKKIKELPALIEDSYSVNFLTLASDGKGNIDIVLLVRNGHNHDVKVFELPIQILNDIKIPIYIGLFNPSDMTVKSRESKLYVLKVKKQDLLKSYDDYSNFEVKIG